MTVMTEPYLQAIDAGQNKIRDTAGTLHFYNPPVDGSSPNFTVTDSSGAGRKNYSHDPRLVSIKDIRGRENHFNLSRHSFTAVSAIAPDHINFLDTEEVKKQYSINAIELILRHVPDSRRVVVFDATVRRASPMEVFNRPVRKVHIDQTPLGALQRVRRHLSDHEAKEVEAGRLRVRLLNVWRPILTPVLDHPLAMAESLTIEDDDLVKVSHQYPEATGETFAVKYNPSQRFWYWSEMTTGEALILQCFDSLQQVTVSKLQQNTRCAHASFTPLGSCEGMQRRQSIEIRCLVLD